MILPLWTLVFEKSLAVNGKSISKSPMVVVNDDLTGLFSQDSFDSIMHLGGQDVRHQSQQFPYRRPSQTLAARRIQRSREHLGLQRHDLLVAIRVVNSIEREMLQAEWENWLLEENVKCKHLGAMLSHNTTELLARKNNDGQRVLDGESRRLEEIRAWQQQYCESCNKELQSIAI